MERTYKFRIYPNQKQIECLNTTLDLCRNLYNSALEERIAAYKKGASINYYDQQNELPKIKSEQKEYGTVYSHTLQDTLRRLDRAFANFYRRLKQRKSGKKVKAGFPRFKSANRFRSITFDRYGFRILPNGHLNLTKLGTIRMFKHREVEGVPKTCTVKRDSVGDWWATISVTLPDVPKQKPKDAIGVDVGLKHLVTLSNGETIEPPKFLRASEEKIKIRQRQVSKKKKGSNNRRKCVEKLAKAHRKVERQRNDFLHKLSRDLSQKADVVVFENLNIQNMQKSHHLAKSIGDAGWGKLIQYTAYKVEETGRSVHFVNPNGTTQVCSRCGETVRKSLSERLHVCPNCGFSVDRDWNAAQNILRRLRTGSAELIKTPVETEPIPLLTGVASLVEEAGSPALQGGEDVTYNEYDT